MALHHRKGHHAVLVCVRAAGYGGQAANTARSGAVEIDITEQLARDIDIAHRINAATEGIDNETYERFGKDPLEPIVGLGDAELDARLQEAIQRAKRRGRMQ